jgi:hypothetical protein
MTASNMEENQIAWVWGTMMEISCEQKWKEQKHP